MIGDDFMLTAGALQAVLDAMGSLTFFIDKGVYTFAKVIYDVFMFVADARLLDNGVAVNLTRRIYAILSIFMLFVLGYNLLLYIIDPDKMTDKEKGMGAIIKNVVIALVIILILPAVFNRLYTLQSMVLKSGVIENLFLGGYTEPSEEELGENSDNDSSASTRIEKGVNIMIANTYAAFLLPDDKNNFTVLQCGETPKEGEEDVKTYDEYCQAWKNVKDTGNIAYFSTFVGNDDYKFFPFVSTIVGIILIFFMLSFCINLAIRAAKLAILQLIAPIPLVLEILPNKQGLRKGWFDEVVKTYLQVFVYMAMIFLVIFLISLVPNLMKGIIAATVGSDVKDGAGTFTMLVASLIICYGLLQFGKEAPGYILKLCGIESQGILKAAGLRAVRMAGAGLSGLGTAGTIGVRSTANMARSVRNAWRDNSLSPDERGDRVLKAVGRGMLGYGGMFTGAARGVYNHRTGGFKGLKKDTSESVRKTQASIDSVAQKASNLEYRLDEAVQGNFNPYDRHRVRDWVFGESFSDTDKEMTALLNATGSKTDYGKDDETYKSFDKKFNEEARDAAINSNSNWTDAFNTWRQEMHRARPDIDTSHFTEAAFARNVLARNGFTDANGNSYSALQAAARTYRAKERQRQLINNKGSNRDKLRNKAIEYVTKIENNRDINLNRPENADIRNAIEAVKELFEGRDIHTRELVRDANGDPLYTGTEIFNRLDRLDRAVKNKQTTVEAEKLSRRSNNNGDSNE